MINSREYWDNRFKSGNWDEFGGKDQTLFFNKLAIEFLPKWVFDDIDTNNLSIADIGCAEGSGTSFFKNTFSRSIVTGIDFSESAINQARKRYPACIFKCQDISELSDNYDVVFSSNVLEHFIDPFDKIETLRKISEKYLILLLPFQEDNLHEEHFIRFDYNSFLLNLKNFHLCYYKVINTKNLEATMWPGKQILLVYGNDDYIDYDKMKLSRIVNNDFEEKEELLEKLNSKNEEVSDLKSAIYSKNDQINIYVKQLEEQHHNINNYSIQLENQYKELNVFKNELDGKNDQINIYVKQLEEQEHQIINYRIQLESQYKELNVFKNELDSKNDQINVYVKKLNEQEHQINNYNMELENKEQFINNYESELKDKNNLIIQFENTLVEFEKTSEVINENLKLSQNIILEAKKKAYMLADTKLFKLVHLAYRLKLQLLKGNFNEKKKFFKWLKDRKNLTKGAQGHQFNPIFQVIDQLEKLNIFYNQNFLNIKIPRQDLNGKAELISDTQIKALNGSESDYKLNLKIDKYDYRKQDIIFLSVISWDFRHQRPQHLAQQFAKAGHRVFYFNVDFTNEFNILKKEENLYIINLDNYYGNRIYDVDFTNQEYVQSQLSTILNDYNIRDCSVIVEYPSWYHVCKYLKDNYKFNVIFDYIDDYEGFEETTHSGLKILTEKLFKLSNLTIATSNFLYEKTKLFCDNVKIVRNGTEFEFFNRALNKNEKKTKKIGYYGAIAEWFDIAKVEHLAKNLPTVEIELVGNVSSEKCYELSKYKNVKFLGEKKYDELVKYLSDYDVCLIPFRSDIDLIKATNPVKFYEYLSAGKKVVATEIPELMPFKDKFVYLTNDDDEFLNYVKLCLNNDDDLADVNEKIRFAKENDWTHRCIEMEDYILKTHELVSIVIVTYNNIEYTKQCINSILEKSAYPNYEIIIVDNASKDDTPEYLTELERKYDNVIIKLNSENKGFAGGNNDGIRLAKGDYIILLNNDTLVTRGWIKDLIKHLHMDNLGMVCPVTNSIGNEAQIKITYKDIQDMDKFAIEYTTRNYNKLYENINVLAMFCVAIKKEVIDKVGLLDENYKVGMFEDDDYSTAIKRAGYKIACAEDVFIHHFGSVSFKKLEDKKYKEIFEHNKAYYEKKWNTIWTPHKYREGIN